MSIFVLYRKFSQGKVTVVFKKEPDLFVVNVKRLLEETSGVYRVVRIDIYAYKYFTPNIMNVMVKNRRCYPLVKNTIEIPGRG